MNDHMLEWDTFQHWLGKEYQTPVTQRDGNEWKALQIPFNSLNSLWVIYKNITWLYNKLTANIICNAVWAHRIRANCVKKKKNSTLPLSQSSLKWPFRHLGGLYSWETMYQVGWWKPSSVWGGSKKESHPPQAHLRQIHFRKGTSGNWWFGSRFL